MKTQTTNFFEAYPRFYKTSTTSTKPNRLNRRYDAIIGAHQEQIRDQRILDIASHDGRWSFAALESDARHVLGIEGRPELVENANETMAQLGIDSERYTFVAGDIHDHIARLEPGSIDTVFCLGFFYHTTQHVYLLEQIKRLVPKWLILDTVIAPHKGRVIYIHKENSERERNAISTSSKDKFVLTGRPSQKALKYMFETLGFEWTYFDWHKAGIKEWHHIKDYEKGKRITVAARNLDVS